MTLEILKQVRCHPEVIEHSKAVSKKALELARRFDVDTELVKTGSILHDIGRAKTNGIDHGIVGVKILEDLGFPEEILKIVERHVGAGITAEEAKVIGLPPKDYLPVSMEEKIVAHADNLIHGIKEVDIDFVIKKWQIKRGYDHPSIERLLKLHQEVVGESISLDK
ncbi:MAG: TIGR00295 family protein [Euryarchaeota archaeon]|nr:TIGR00295 family protein [Euryarchaeota archaeon]